MTAGFLTRIFLSRSMAGISTAKRMAKPKGNCGTGLAEPIVNGSQALVKTPPLLNVTLAQK